jgi:hypothetical protein
MAAYLVELTAAQLAAWMAAERAELMVEHWVALMG